ncbi:nuclear transport factor 2 family protein [Rhizorhabdus wittichii]|uniref:Nuclear transport factor 2 family protein n=1 Tax=Rhizorhabdus wittichii TaxID=160791 RepID=A0A975D0P1_9SPHN|nr:nuclear transport factor 2 family protein [Rhizorhabdus wittichii]QTH20718.1 nuclear transport factor 2 family protein [Rhizorhabdus wittichii]
MTDPEKNLVTVRRFWDAIGSGDVDAYLATFAPGAVARDPVNRPPLETDEQRRAYLEGVLGAFSDIRVATDFVTSCGDHTASKWTLTAKGGDGSDVRLEGIDVARHAEDGRIAELWGFF